MKALQLPAFGLENLRLVEVDTPEPGPGQVLVRVEAAALNYLDLVVISGKYNPHLPLPLVPGSDAAGVVAAVGAGVTEWQPGDRVTTTYYQDWLDGDITPEQVHSTLGSARPGVLAEYLVLPAHGLVRTPRHLSSAQSATLPIAGVTAWTGLMEHARLQAGQTVLVQGTGGVSVFALQLAKAAGARVIATSSSPAKLAQLQALGANEVLNYAETPDWAAEVRRLTDGRGADVTLDVAGSSLNQSMQAVRLNGFVGVVGFVGSSEVKFNVFTPIGRKLQLRGYSVGSRRNFQDLIAQLESHQITPVVDAEYALPDFAAALQHLTAGRHVGKVVLTF